MMRIFQKKMVGYPAELDEVYAESFEEQKK